MKRREIPIGSKFGKLTLIEIPSWFNDPRYVGIFRCDCGKVRKICVADICRKGGVESCGCLNGRNRWKNKTDDRLYIVWTAMIHRCYDLKSEKYYMYGARGIEVCERWKSWDNFHDDMQKGYSPELQIDRINNGLGYFKENCRWVTRSENCNNTRRNNFIEHDGQRMTLTQWSRKLGIKRSTLSNRIVTLGWSIEKSFNHKKFSK